MVQVQLLKFTSRHVRRSAAGCGFTRPAARPFAPVSHAAGQIHNLLYIDTEKALKAFYSVHIPFVTHAEGVAGLGYFFTSVCRCFCLFFIANFMLSPPLIFLFFISGLAYRVPWNFGVKRKPPSSYVAGYREKHETRAHRNWFLRVQSAVAVRRMT